MAGLVGPLCGAIIAVIGMKRRARARRLMNQQIYPRGWRSKHAGDPYTAQRPPQRRLPGTKTAVAGALILAVTGVTELGYLAFSGVLDTAPLAVGQCVTSGSLTALPHPHSADCTQGGTFTLAAVSDAEYCPDGPAAETLYVAIGHTNGKTWCFLARTTPRRGAPPREA